MVDIKDFNIPLFDLLVASKTLFWLLEIERNRKNFECFFISKESNLLKNEQFLRVDLNTFRDIIFATFYKTNILLRVFKDEPQKAIFHILFGNNKRKIF